MSDPLRELAIHPVPLQLPHGVIPLALGHMLRQVGLLGSAAVDPVAGLHTMAAA